MNHLNKLALLTSIFALSLTSCSNKTRCECLETCNSPDYVEGMCYQVCRKNIVESVFVLDLPLNPEDPTEQYKYDFEWREEMRVEYISLEGGLKGKRIISFLKLDPHSMKLDIDGALENPNATSGYVKISHLAFKPLSERAKNSNLFAYVAIGDERGLVEKPAQTQENE